MLLTMTEQPAATARRLRFLAGGLLVILVLLPALARAGQVLAFGPGHAKAAAGFHKVLDAPPDPAQPAVDRVVVFRPPAPAGPTPRTAYSRSPLPPSPAIAEWDALRAPPAARSLA